MGNQLIVDLPDDLKQRLKLYCAKNGKTMSDEVIALLCQKLEQEAKEQDDGDVFGEGEPPFLQKSPDKGLDVDGLKKDVLEEVDGKLSPIQQSLEDLRTSFKDDVQHTERSFKPASECKADIDKKFLALAKLLGSMMDVVKKTSGANVCANDVKALAYLANEPTEKWYQKDQFNDLLDLLKKR